MLEVTKKIPGKYNIVHICGEMEFGFQSTPRRYAGYPGDLFNWDVHRAGLSLEEGRKLFQKPILGGLDNHGVLVEGSLEAIRQETLKIIKAIGKARLHAGGGLHCPRRDRLGPPAGSRGSRRGSIRRRSS